MPSSSAGGRDNPHSSAASADDGSARRGTVTATPIGLGLVLAAVAVAVSPLPASWGASAEHPIVLPTPGPLGGLWDAVTLAVPLGERGLRGELGLLALVLATAAAAGLLALRLYRGVGRGPAACAAVPVCAAVLLAWLRGSGAADAAAALGGTLLATIGLALVIGRPRVQVALGGALALLAALALWLGTGRFGHVLADSSWFAGLRMHLDLVGPARWTGPALLDLGLALLVLLVFPLRWRGGWPLLGLGVIASTLADRAGPLVPTPALLVLLSVAACGWIWLAGSVPARRRAIGSASAAAAMLAVLAMTATQVVPATEPIAARRASDSLLTLHQRGLLAPGDVLLAHEPWLAAAFAAAQRDEGLRPDVELHAASELAPAGLSDRLAAWSRTGRRVLSDSFSYAGRWQAAWTLDSGPLFWFVGTASAADRDFTELHEHSPDLEDPSLAPAERARWERMHVERARHRRALGQHDEALLALPLDQEALASLVQRLHFAKLSRLPAADGSELGPAAWSAAPAPASALAEAGDLLLALGDGEAGTQRLADAAARGVAGAFAALVRWQLRAGEEEAARGTLEILAAAPVLRPQLLAVCRWLLARARAQQAAGLLAGSPPAPGHAAEELAVRLATLRGVSGL